MNRITSITTSFRYGGEPTESRFKISTSTAAYSPRTSSSATPPKVALWLSNHDDDEPVTEVSIELRPVLTEGFWGSSGVLLNWIAMRLNTDRPVFERVAIQKDIDELKEFLEQDRLDRKTGQMGLLLRMAGVGVSTTDRLQTPSTASAFHRQLHLRSHQPIEHRPVWRDVKWAGLNHSQILGAGETRAEVFM